MGIISPEQRERAQQKSRLTSITKRVEKYKTGQPAPADEDLWELAGVVVADWAPPNAEKRDWLRRMLDMSANADEAVSSA